MATRPIGNPPIWSSIALYPAGVDPWSGNARNVAIPTGEDGGFTPGTGVVAEYANAEFNVLSTWVEWLSFGSNAAGLDAHVVETDSAGVSAIAGLTAGGTAGAFPAITATANAGATGSVISATNNSGGFAILANSNGVLAAIRGVSTGVQRPKERFPLARQRRPRAVFSQNREPARGGSLRIEQARRTFSCVASVFSSFVYQIILLNIFNYCSSFRIYKFTLKRTFLSPSTFPSSCIIKI